MTSSLVLTHVGIDVALLVGWPLLAAWIMQLRTLKAALVETVDAQIRAMAKTRYVCLHARLEGDW
eukprot:scaffold2879_cov269-Prasinococcus_capsulatus_cf.AAC.37